MMKNKRKISQPIIILKRTGLSLFASGIAYAALTENTQENIPLFHHDWSDATSITNRYLTSLFSIRC
ncbi:MAG: hypothetical protein RSC83_16590, partial [Hafnia sp.]